MSQENDFEIKVGDEFKTKLALKTALMLHSAVILLFMWIERRRFIISRQIYTQVFHNNYEEISLLAVRVTTLFKLVTDSLK